MQARFKKAAVSPRVMSAFKRTMENEPIWRFKVIFRNWSGGHALEMEIAEALKHNSTDDLKVVDLKRQKLHLKDEIERLKHGVAGD